MCEWESQLSTPHSVMMVLNYWQLVDWTLLHSPVRHLLYWNPLKVGWIHLCPWEPVDLWYAFRAYWDYTWLHVCNVMCVYVENSMLFHNYCWINLTIFSLGGKCEYNVWVSARVKSNVYGGFQNELALEQPTQNEHRQCNQWRLLNCTNPIQG